jgi:hypothetical protein
MKNSILITPEVKKVALIKADRMPLGTISRLKVNNEISDICISPSSSGVWFYNVPGTITVHVSEQIIGFVTYNDLN